MTAHSQPPDVVVVGAATRDVDPADPRGWRLGGGVTYGALTLARLGLRTATVIGLDALASEASELDLLRGSGVAIAPAPLSTGPIFHNIEQSGGRVQISYSGSDPVAVDALPEAWRGARAWLFAAVAAELPDAWSEIPSEGSCVAFGWQGMLRILIPGKPVQRLPAGPSPLLGRATIVGMSRQDLPPATPLREVASWLRPDAEILLTAGRSGGMLIGLDGGSVGRMTRYPAVAATELDPTGAGDVVLAAFLAARIGSAAAGTRRSGAELQLAATAAAVMVEGTGLGAVGSLAKVRHKAGKPSGPG